MPSQAKHTISGEIQAGLASTPERSLNQVNGFFGVVRAYFKDREMVTDLASWLEPWEVHYDLGYLVVGVTTQEYKLMELAGFRLEIDHELTDFYTKPEPSHPWQTSGIPNYECYRTVEETYNSAQLLATTHPGLATWTDIGDSWDKTFTSDSLPGYDMKVLKLTNSAIPGPKPKLFIMAAVHAREYATAELATRFAEYLVNNYNIDPDATWLLDYHEIHLVLQANPDGRKKAEVITTKLWRKNTNQNYCGTTSMNRGADLNRNFSFEWGNWGGSSGDPCYETYRGPTAASEPEVVAIQNYVRAQFPDQRLDPLDSPAPSDASGVFVDLHSYSNLVLWPWGFEVDAPNGAGLQTLGRKFAKFNGYTPEQSVNLYPTDGTTTDFAYGDLGLAAYTFEMGLYTFSPGCTTFENTILPGNLPALVYAAKVARTPYLTPSGPDTLNVLTQPNENTVRSSLLITATIDDTRYNNSMGTEPVQNISTAAYTIDTPPWTAGAQIFPMSALDGAFNQTIETVTASVNTKDLTNGRHILFVRGQDADGNWGAVSAAFFQANNPYQVMLDPIHDSGSSYPGGQVEYTLHITNTGALADTYEITSQSNWEITLSTPLGPLPPEGGSITLNSGESLNLTAHIIIPLTAPFGLIDLARVILVSQGDGTIMTETSLTTTALQEIFLPLVSGK